jgi:cytochrome b
MSDAKNKVLVWDAPVRVFHWLLVLSFFGAFITAESERWRLVHVILGYTVGGLVVFRVLWGLVGTRYARFASFVRGPRAVARYIGSLLRGQTEHHLGHNPAGALAIVLLLLLSAVTVASGWANYNEIGGHWLEELHEVVGNLMLLVVGVHVAGVLVSSWLHRENLLRAMVTGKKQGAPAEGIRWNWWPLALLVLVAVLGFWWQQWDNSASAPTGSTADTPTQQVKKRKHERDDD